MRFIFRITLVAMTIALGSLIIIAMFQHVDAEGPTGSVGVPAVTPINSEVTQDNIQVYLKNQQFPPHAIGSGTVDTTIIVYTTLDAVTNDTGESTTTTGLTPNMRVFYVQLSGQNYSVTFYGPPDVSVTFPYSVFVIDPVTGNILLSGGRPTASPTFTKPCFGKCGS